MRVENKDLSVGSNPRRQTALTRILWQTFLLFVNSSAAWLGLQSGVLILMPKVIISLLTEEAHHTTGRRAHSQEDQR